jgi:DGQHR domain-containing protein
MTLAETKFADPDDIIFRFPCISVRQPIGELFVGALPFKVLCSIADFDVRHVIEEERDLDKYLGIQRPLKKDRVRQIEQFVNFADASFPSSIIIAVDDRCAQFDRETSTMTLRNVTDPNDPVLVRRIARVIDGQHRIAGLYQCRQEHFECPVTILVGTDLADQAQMFARVNLSQTPVSPSLVYDLFELSKSKSPQKTCHDLTVRLDRGRDGPFFKRIKRLGTATPGRDAEFLTQSTVVRGMMQHISEFPDRDRDIYLRGKEPSRPSRREQNDMIYREWFLDRQDDRIYEEIVSMFEAVRKRWPIAWNTNGRGYMLARTNGYFAIMRFLRDSTLYWGGPGKPVSVDNHSRLLEDVDLKDDDLTTMNFPPGTAGEAKLYATLRAVVPR